MEDYNWIDRKEYPFKSNFIQLEMGRMHYIDEGSGSPIVMVHGNPTWSFLYRHLIKGLSKNCRCIAPDYIGFGLSDKPTDWSYLREEHAKNLTTLIKKLELKNITFVSQDWGGPISLSCAISNHVNVKRIILMNTWMWSGKGDPHFEMFSSFKGGAIGRFLIKRFNFFARVILRQGMANRSKLTKPIHQHYLKPFENPEERKGCWVFPKQIIASSDWLDSLWSQREKIKGIPALILWGMKDFAFREKELNRWTDLLTNCKTVKLNDAAHFVQEDKGNELCPFIENFLAKYE